jgi:hypothetical protein
MKIESQINSYDFNLTHYNWVKTVTIKFLGNLIIMSIKNVQERNKRLYGEWKHTELTNRENDLCFDSSVRTSQSTS